MLARAEAGSDFGACRDGDRPDRLSADLREYSQIATSSLPSVFVRPTTRAFMWSRVGGGTCLRLGCSRLE